MFQYTINKLVVHGLHIRRSSINLLGFVSWFIKPVVSMSYIIICCKEICYQKLQFPVYYIIRYVTYNKDYDIMHWQTVSQLCLLRLHFSLSLSKHIPYENKLSWWRILLEFRIQDEWENMSVFLRANITIDLEEIYVKSRWLFFSH